jgi:hypothetical protein
LEKRSSVTSRKFFSAIVYFMVDTIPWVVYIEVDRNGEHKQWPSGEELKPKARNTGRTWAEQDRTRCCAA